MDERAHLERQRMAKGFGLGLSRAFEIALVPFVLGLLGYGLDRLIGTRLIFTILLSVLGVAGTFVKLYFGYSHDMAQHEVGAPWNKPRARAEEGRS